MQIVSRWEKAQLWKWRRRKLPRREGKEEKDAVHWNRKEQAVRKTHKEEKTTVK